MRMQVSCKIDRRPRAAKGGPRAADNLVQVESWPEPKVYQTVQHIARLAKCPDREIRCFVPCRTRKITATSESFLVVKS